MSGWYPWSVCTFLKGNGGEMDLGGEAMFGEELGRREERESNDFDILGYMTQEFKNSNNDIG